MIQAPVWVSVIRNCHASCMTHLVINKTRRVKIMSGPAVYFHLRGATRGLRPRRTLPSKYSRERLNVTRFATYARAVSSNAV